MARRDMEHVQLPIPNGWFALEFSHELREGEAPQWDFPEQPVFDRTSEVSAEWSEPRAFADTVSGSR